MVATGQRRSASDGGAEKRGGGFHREDRRSRALLSLVADRRDRFGRSITRLSTMPSTLRNSFTTSPRSSGGTASDCSKMPRSLHRSARMASKPLPFPHRRNSRRRHMRGIGCRCSRPNTRRGVCSCSKQRFTRSRSGLDLDTQVNRSAPRSTCSKLALSAKAGRQSTSATS